MSRSMDMERDDISLRKNVPRSSPSFFARAQTSIEEVDTHTKFYGMFTLFTTLVVIGMSIYVVHYKEVRMDADGRNLVNAQRELMITDNPTSSINGITDLAKLSSEKLSTIKNVDFFATLPSGNAEIMMDVSKTIRLDSGELRVYSVNGDVLSTDGTTAVYKDLDMCSTPPYCKVILKVEDAGSRRLFSPRIEDHTGRRKLWGSLGRWFRSRFSSAPSPPPSSPPSPPPSPPNHDHGDHKFTLKRINNNEIFEQMSQHYVKDTTGHEAQLQGLFWLDQFGSFTDNGAYGSTPGDSSDVDAVAAADAVMSFGESTKYTLPIAMDVTVGGEKYTLRHRRDVEVFGGDVGNGGAWQWFDEEGENHSFKAASMLSLYYQFIWNDEFTFCKIVFTANIFGVEVTMPEFLATYWMKRGWKGTEDSDGLKWDRISYIGPYWSSWFSSVWHYPVFKIYKTSNPSSKTTYYNDYLKLANCKCGPLDRATYDACIANPNPTFTCETSLLGVRSDQTGAAAANQAAQTADGNKGIGSFTKSWEIGM